MKNITLENSLEVYFNKKKLEESATYLIINSGNWQDEIHGTAHVLEHLQSVKSKIYGDKAILNYTRADASTYNKRTIYSFEHILPEHLLNALNNLKEVYTLNIDMLEREKEAIYYEMLPSLNPLQKFLEDAFDILFPVYSKKIPSIDIRIKSLKNINKEVIRRFWNKHYNPENSVLYISGEIPYKLDELTEGFKKIPNKGNKTKKTLFNKEKELKDRIEIKEKVRDDNVASIRIAYQLPPFPGTSTLKEYISINLFSTCLNADHGKLYNKLRDKHKLCYSLETNYITDLGRYSAFVFDIQTKPNLCHKVEKEWLNTIKEISQGDIPENTLENFKNRMKINIIHNKHEFDLKSVLWKIDHNIIYKDYRKELSKVTKDDIVNAAKILKNKPYVISIALPIK